MVDKETAGSFNFHLPHNFSSNEHIIERESSFQVVCLMQRVGIGSTDYCPIDISFIPIACFLDIVLIFYGEILSWSLIGFKGLRSLTKCSKQQ